MSDLAPSPAALSDGELRETLELLSTVVASLSDRMDDQTKALDRINRTATEARQAAFAAKAQTDPERYSDLVGQTLDGQLSKTLQRLDQASDLLGKQSRLTVDLLAATEKNRTSEWKQVWEGEARMKRFKRRLLWLGLATAVAVLAMSVALPRFMASNPTTCAVLGAAWTSPYSDIGHCAFRDQ